MITIVETESYQKRSPLNQAETERLIQFLAANPEAGEIMTGTGGVRKVRFAQDNRGKSGSVRVVYYFCDHDMPLFLLAVFSKNVKANLSASEKNILKKLVKQLKKEYGQ